jgi:hypothetical protein
VSAAAKQLALALERGEVASLTVKTSTPDRLLQDLVDAGAKLELPVAEKSILDRGARMRWRQGSVVLDGTPVLVASEMEPAVRSPFTAGISLAPVADAAHELAAEIRAELGGEAG